MNEINAENPITEADVGRWVVTRGGDVIQVMGWIGDEFYPVATAVPLDGGGESRTELGMVWFDWDHARQRQESPGDLIRWATIQDRLADITTQQLIDEIHRRHGMTPVQDWLLDRVDRLDEMKKARPAQ